MYLTQEQELVIHSLVRKCIRTRYQMSVNIVICTSNSLIKIFYYLDNRWRGVLIL